MCLGEKVGKRTWKGNIMFALIVLLGIWMIREPLSRALFCEDTQIINQLRANVEQQKINISHNELETDLKKRSQSFRKIGTLI